MQQFIVGSGLYKVVINFGSPRKSLALPLALTGQCNDYGASSAGCPHAPRKLTATYVGQAEVGMNT